MNIYTYIIVSVLSGIVCFIIARKKGLNPWPWALLGLILSIAGVGIVSFIREKIKK